MSLRVVAAVLLIMVADPIAARSGSLAFPAHGDAALFVIAIVGLFVGRQASRRSPRQDDDTRT